MPTFQAATALASAAVLLLSLRPLSSKIRLWDPRTSDSCFSCGVLQLADVVRASATMAQLHVQDCTFNGT